MQKLTQPLQLGEISQQKINQFLCPITSIMMKDPVTAADNHVYQRKNISLWLKKTNLSPVNGKPFVHRVLIDNTKLKQEIEQYIQKYKIPSSPQEVEIEINSIIIQKLQQLKLPDYSQLKKQQGSFSGLKAEQKVTAIEKMYQKQIDGLKHDFKLKQEELQNFKLKQEELQKQIIVLSNEKQQQKRKINFLNEKIRKMDESAADYVRTNLHVLKENFIFKQHLTVRDDSNYLTPNQPNTENLKKEANGDENNAIQQQFNLPNQIQMQDEDSVVSMTDMNKKTSKKFQLKEIKTQDASQKLAVIDMHSQLIQQQQNLTIQKKLNEGQQDKKLVFQDKKYQTFQQCAAPKSLHQKIAKLMSEKIAKTTSSKQQKSPVNVGNSDKVFKFPTFIPVQDNKKDEKQAEQLKKLVKFVSTKQQQDFKKKTKERHQKEDQLNKYFDNDKFRVTPNQFPSYIGQKIKNKKQGLGKQVMKQKNQSYIYLGQFKNDCRQGFGKLQYNHGDKYVGYFKNGMRQGFGKYGYKKQPYKGDKYQGYWIGNDRSGYGKQLLSHNGQIYEGFWKKDMRQGMGRILYKNNDIYQGFFHQNKKHGQGTLKHSDGKMQKQFWKNGELQNGVKKVKM